MKTIKDLNDEEIKEHASNFSLLTGMDLRETTDRFFMMRDTWRENEGLSEEGKEENNDKEQILQFLRDSGQI